MPVSDLETVRLEARHLQAACELSTVIGWNQVLADWEMMLRQGSGIGLQDPAGRIVATAVCLPYGQTFGWISMVLVHPDWRKQGLATYLLNECIDLLESQGLVPVLDATPAGDAVYRPLGFKPQLGLTRWQIEAGASTEVVGNARPMTRADLPTVRAMDEQVFGGPRALILDSLFSRAAPVCRIMPDGSGIALARDGRLATQIGPVLASSDGSALALLAAAVRAAPGPVFVDALDEHQALTDWLDSSGFTRQRPFTRMAKQHPDPFGAPKRLYVAAGPELG